MENTGIYETRWKYNGNLINGETKYHRNGVGFMIHKYIKDTVMEFTFIY